MMLLTVYSEYRKHRYFNLDCQVSNLLGVIKHEILNESLKFLKITLNKWEDNLKILELEIDKIKQQLIDQGEDPEKDNTKISSKQNSKKSPVDNPLQMALKDNENKISNLKLKIEKVIQKITWCEEKSDEKFISKFDLMDSMGEPQHLNQRKNLRASEILRPKKLYYLGIEENNKEELQPIALEGIVAVNLGEEGCLEQNLNFFAPLKATKGK